MSQMSGVPPNPGINPMGGGMPGQLPQHMQQQQILQQQQLQQMQANNAGQMFMGQGVGNIPGVGMGPANVPMGVGPRPPFNPVGNQMGPLAYLEKTTSNIDMGDGRR